MHSFSMTLVPSASRRNSKPKGNGLHGPRELSTELWGGEFQLTAISPQCPLWTEAV